MPAFRLNIFLTEKEIREAIIFAAIGKIDLGVPFCNDDIVLYSLDLKSAHVEIIPDRKSSQPERGPSGPSGGGK